LYASSGQIIPSDVRRAAISESRSTIWPSGCNSWNVRATPLFREGSASPKMILDQGTDAEGLRLVIKAGWLLQAQQTQGAADFGPADGLAIPQLLGLLLQCLSTDQLVPGAIRTLLSRCAACVRDLLLCAKHLFVAAIGRRSSRRAAPRPRRPARARHRRRGGASRLLGSHKQIFGVNEQDPGPGQSD
jgi:hypothetical protein